jgi:hypothetical protein
VLNPLVAGEPTYADVLEKTTPRYTAVIKDNQGNAIPAASLVTLTLLLYVIKADGTTSYIRGAVGAPQNVLNANNVTVDSNGNLVWSIQVADTTLVEAVPFERHVALWTWTTATITGRHELILVVKNLTELS